MKKIDMIVRAAHFFTMQGEGVGYKGNAAMAVDCGKIIAIENELEIQGSYEAEEVIDLSRHAVLPGFIDAHMHTSMSLLRGLAQDTANWMMYGVQPFANALSRDAANIGSQLAIIEAVRNGTTTIGDYDSNMDFVCGLVNKIGLRGNISYTIREAQRRIYHPGELYEYDRDLGEKSLEANIELYDKWHGRNDGRIRILFGPQGADFVSKELLLRVQKIAKEKKTKIHMHVQQGDRETYQIEKRYGMRPVAWLSEIGYLDEALIAVHLTDACDEEAEIVAKSGASMILCPGSIGIIDGIVPPCAAFQIAGGNSALGSDQAPGNNCHNIFNEMKNAALFNKIKYSDPEVMPAWRVLRMATIEGAKAVGIGDIVGSLEPGKHADFIAVDLTKPTMLPVYTSPMRNIVPNLVYSARGDEVVLSVVDGKIVYRDGRINGIDVEECCREAQIAAAFIGKAAEPEFAALKGTNYNFMLEGKL